MSITADYHEALDLAIQKHIQEERRSSCSLEVLGHEIAIETLRSLRRDFYELDEEGG